MSPHVDAVVVPPGLPAVGGVGKLKAMHACQKISSKGWWPELEHAAIQTVIAGGMAAMGYYRDAWGKQQALDEEQPNASTTADVQATVAVLRTCHSLLSPIAGDLACGLSYFGEESCHDDLLRQALSGEVMHHKHSAEVFFENNTNMLRVIFDGIDGTQNFDRGVPLFCTAMAILADDQVRVSALYDLIHHEIFSAVLPGPYEKPEEGARASAWQVASGSRSDLVAQASRRPDPPLAREAVGLHFTRSRTKRKQLEAFIRPTDGADDSALERLATRSEGLYALNSGLMAMTLVARGGLGAFVNPATNPWDVAAGEVIVRACGGQVTTFSGHPISYSSVDPLSVVAAKASLHPELIGLLRPCTARLQEIASGPSDTEQTPAT